MKSWSKATGLVAFLLVIPGVLHAESVALLATKDNTLIESGSGHLSDGSGPGIRAGRTGQPMGSIRRAVVAFDIAAAVPAGAEILDVRLILQMAQANSGPLPVSVHRLLADWGEGDSSFPGGQGAPSEPGDATWIHRFYDTDFWGTPGGDFMTSPSATALVGGPGIYEWNDPEMVADVQLWLDLPAANFGWLTLGDERTSNSVKRFHSRESGAPGIPPLLLVDYAPPDGDDEDADDEDADDEDDDRNSTGYLAPRLEPVPSTGGRPHAVAPKG